MENTDRIWNSNGFTVGYMKLEGFDDSWKKMQRGKYISSVLHPKGNKCLESFIVLSISLDFCCGQLFAFLDYIYFTFSNSLSSLFNNISCPKDNHPLRFFSAVSVSLM